MHKHRGARVGRRAGHHPGDALGVLVVVRSGHRPARGDVGRLEAEDVGVGQVESDVDQLHPPAVGQRVHRLQAAERDGQRGVHGRAADRAGRDVDPAGDVDGHHRNPLRVNGFEYLGRVRSQRPRAGDTDDAVDHQIGRRVDAVDDPAAGLAERGQALLVGALGFEQDRVGGHPAAAQVGRRPQRVAAVVARADDRAHPSSGDAAGAGGQLADDRGGQSVGRTAPSARRRAGWPTAALRPRGSRPPSSSAALCPDYVVRQRGYSRLNRLIYLGGVDMARTDNDTWDLATSVGATATGVAVGRALANRADNPLINDPFAEPLVRAVGVDFFTRLASGELDAGRCRRRRRVRHAADGRHDGRAHPLLRRLLHRGGQRRNPPGGDPGVRARCPRLPAALAGRDHRVRDRPAHGHRVQGHRR